MKTALKVCGIVMAVICFIYGLIMLMAVGAGGFSVFMMFIFMIAAGAYSLVMFFSFAKHFENQEESIDILKQISGKLDRGGVPSYLSNGSANNAEETWICPKCGCPNPKSMRSCKSCGHCI